VSIASSDPVFEGGGNRRGLTVKRHPRAKAMRLRVDPRDGRVLLTLPARASLKRAHKWAESQRGWIEIELAKLPAAAPIGPGETIPWRGELLTIDWNEVRPRQPRRDVERLLVGGPAGGVENRVLRWLKSEARLQLGEETQFYAERAGVRVDRIAIGDARSRWGSCSAKGAIRYSWRLILAPPRVLSATAAHEVAHRLHMDHSPAFHAAVARLFGGDPRPERRWLREHGAALHRFGCSS